MSDSQAGIWVVAEHREGSLCPATYETLAFADKIAKVLKRRLSVVVLGDPVAAVAEEIARGTGCDVLGVESPGALQYHPEIYRACLKDLFALHKPWITFVPHTATGWDFAPALAIDLGAICLTAISSFEISDALTFVRPILNGKLVEYLAVPDASPVVATVLPGSESWTDENPEKAGAVSICSMPPVDIRARIVGFTENPITSTNLREADVVVSAGRGVGTYDAVELVRGLAAAFPRSAFGASRPLCDQGWVPLEHQVGMTGQTVSPTLYIACGISGAQQHTVGMKSSRLIIAINLDPDALFCRLAHYSVIADLHTFIPAFIQAIKARKGPRDE